MTTPQAESAPILVTGATGKLGRILVPRLLNAGRRVRALTRRPQVAADLFNGRVEIAEGDFALPDSLGTALTGIKRVLLLSPISDTLARDQIALIDAAKAAGVERIVKISGSDWTIGTSLSGDAHQQVEDYLAASGLEHVSIRPNAWLQVGLAQVVEQIRQRQPLYARHGAAKVGYVDVRDIADVAVSQLVAEIVAQGPLVITGPNALCTSDIAALASSIVGSMVQTTFTAPAATRPHGDGFEARVVLQFFEVIGRGGAAGLTDTVERVLGRPPRSVAAYLREQLTKAPAEA